jgi:predicted ATPase
VVARCAHPPPLSRAPGAPRDPTELGKLNSASLILGALTDAEADALIDSLQGDSELTPRLRRQIADKAEGNPLFVEQMLALLAEKSDPDTVVEVPPTIQTLLAARLDRISDVERMVIERAAVIGTRFWRSAVTELVPADLRETVPGRTSTSGSRP